MSTVTPDYSIDYEDERFQQVEAEKNQALTDVKNTYDSMIENSDKYYDDLINQSKENADKQAQIQQENTDFAIEKVEQQREQDKKDYIKEQSGAYTDWQKQINQYGVNAEQMAMSGLANSGYSESAQVQMYVAYQSRVSNARELMAQANQNANNLIQQAILQNNSALAEIYAQANKEQLEIALQGFQYKNSLLEAQMNELQEAEDRYYNRYQDVLAQLNQENALAEQIRQFNEDLAMQQKALDEEIRQFEQDYALRVKEYEEGIRQFNEEIARLKAQDKAEAEYKAQQLALQKAQLEEEKRQFDLEYKQKQQEYQIAIDNVTSSAKSGISGAISSVTSAIKNAVSGSTSTNKLASDTSYVSRAHKVSTPYWRGAINSDVAKYGAFNTEYDTTPYQPKGISGHGYLTATGQTVQVTSVVKYGNYAGMSVTNTQKVWKAEDGTKWIWNGTANKYEKYSG